MIRPNNNRIFKNKISLSFSGIDFRFLFLLIFLLLIGQPLSAKKSAEELLKELEHTTNDSIKINIFLSLCTKYSHENPDLGIKYSGQALALAVKRKSLKEMADCYYYMADSYFYRGTNDSVLRFLGKEQLIRIEMKDTINLAFNFRKYGDFYYQKGQLIKATRNYTTAIKLWSAKKKFWNCANVYVDLGNVNYSQRKFNEAISYYKTAVEDFRRAKDDASANGVLMNIGSIYLETKKIQEAKEVFGKIREEDLAGKVQVEVLHGFYINNLVLWSELREKKKAEFYLEKANQIYDKSDNPVVRLNHSFSLAQYHIIFGEYNKALNWIKTLENVSGEIGSLDYQKIAYNLYAECYSGMGNYKMAYDNMVSYDNIKDSILSIDNRKQVAELESEFNSERKELENKSLRAESMAKDAEIEKGLSDSKRQNVIIVAFAIGMTLTAGFLYFVYKNLRENKRKSSIIERQKAEVDAAYIKLNERNKEVLDSIKYARRIQTALMSTEKYIGRNLSRLRNEDESKENKK